ncbi:hypothetical protein [uncultured Algibacter sp.]|uniref:hypothetical protein n=1 Tax=uncultured Algibacter sp. TaxID=298659 RepID=UPI00260986D0|nr:hypothetical protein [uncultured Algibacter sp.]
MKTKIFSILITCLISLSMFSQANLNSYKYIIVPNKYDFLKEKDQYQLNSLSKFLFNKYGFLAVMEGTEYPEDLIRNRCLALKSDVIKDSGMFKTKLTIELTDCNDKHVYTSKVGESREKAFKSAYNFALRDAFKSFEALNYKYEPNERVNSLATSQDISKKNEVAQEIQQLKEEIQNLKKEKVVEAVKPEPKVSEPLPNFKERVEEAVTKVKTPETSVKQAVSGVLYAQEIENGFQLVDSSPKVVYKIKSSSLHNVFFVEGKNAIIYKKGDAWILEYYVNGTLKKEALNIKF